MRKCLRCNEEMIEDLDLRIKGSGWNIVVAKKGTIFGSHPYTTIKLAVCPECGYTETYVEDTAEYKNIPRN